MREKKVFVVDGLGKGREVKSLPQKHQEFDERFLQELLVSSPQLLPVSSLRPDVGELICIGREVPTRNSGTMDNLYLSTGGYIVLVETKLWRNPEARRAVVSQVLDYVKDLATRDFEWLNTVWKRFVSDRGLKKCSLLDSVLEEAARH